MAGSFATIPFGSHFMGPNGSAAVIEGELSLFGVGTEVYSLTVDEPGGILAFATGGSDDDNAVITTGGKLKPADGGMWIEARFKYSNVDCAVFVGFTETLDTTTPVMPAEFATATMTYRGSGGMVGFNYDVDGTTTDFRAVMGDGGAATASSGNGTRANATVTADRWIIARVNVGTDGSAECWLADVGHADANGVPSALRLIKRFTAGITPTDLFYPVLMIENRTGNTRTLEVDYLFGAGNTDWACT